jgi:hypothetical protein
LQSTRPVRRVADFGSLGLMADLDDIAELSEPEREIVALWVVLVRQQAELRLHEFLLDQLLGSKERAESLRVRYNAELKKAMDDALASMSDTNPTRASRIRRLLSAADEKLEGGQT